jgi:class 3 adenylate cyclase
VATISTLVSIAGVLLLLYLAYVSYYGTWGLPTKLQKAAAAMRKRMEGLPRSGAVSIMVTDVEGYSGECCFLLAFRTYLAAFWCSAAAAAAGAVVLLAHNQHSPPCPTLLLPLLLQRWCPLLLVHLQPPLTLFWRSAAVTAAAATAVVTALVSSLPSGIMCAAMDVHNSLLRKASWQHYGAVVTQEGDSFVVAFREAVDAVSCCLQVQQALQKADWPLELLPVQQQALVAPAASSRSPFFASFLRRGSSLVGAPPGGSQGRMPRVPSGTFKEGDAALGGSSGLDAADSRRRGGLSSSRAGSGGDMRKTSLRQISWWPGNSGQQRGGNKASLQQQQAGGGDVFASSDGMVEASGVSMTPSLLEEVAALRSVSQVTPPSYPATSHPVTRLLGGEAAGRGSTQGPKVASLDALNGSTSSSSRVGVGEEPDTAPVKDVGEMPLAGAGRRVASRQASGVDAGSRSGATKGLGSQQQQQHPLPANSSYTEADSSEAETGPPGDASALVAAGMGGEAADPLAAAAAELIRGLRVRIGVATGELEEGQDITGSRVLDVAKGGCG